MSKMEPMDTELILESLAHTKRAYRSTEYPTDGMRREKIERVERAIKQVQALRDRENSTDS